MSVIRGVDGCKAGWLCLSVRPGETRPTATVFPDALTLFAEPAIVTTIDIPIGLPSIDTRRVDSKARRLLGPMKSSVFPVPVRATLNATSYEQACTESYNTCGKKLSRQTFGILPRIRDVDMVLRNSPKLVGSVREIHPEACFVYWNDGRPLRYSKKTRSGFMERLEMIRKFFGSSLADVRAAVPHSQAADDDILDAFAALWTALRVYEGTAIRIDEPEERDAFGLPMQIWA